jgi:TatA/E family protein of Tat protein translocase
MLDIGFQELAVIGVLALLIFGPDKLPELGRRLGRAMREFRRASDEFRSTVEQNLQIHADTDISPPTPSPFEPTAAGPTEGGTLVTEATAAGGQGTNGQVSEPGAREGEAAVDGPLEPYWTSRGGRLLHRRECAWRARVPVSERVPLQTARDGWEQGLQACPVCSPKEADVPS